MSATIDLRLRQANSRLAGRRARSDLPPAAPDCPSKPWRIGRRLTEAAVHALPRARDPLPLAVSHDRCAFRRAATQALDAIRRLKRVAHARQRIAGIYAAVETGLAVGTILPSNLRPGLAVLGEAEGLPPLPEISILLLRRSDAASPLLDAMAEHVVAGLRLAGPQGLAA